VRALTTLIWVAAGSGRVQCGTVAPILRVIVRAHLLMVSTAAGRSQPWAL